MHLPKRKEQIGHAPRLRVVSFTAIDPGTTESAFVRCDLIDGAERVAIKAKGKVSNEALALMLKGWNVSFVVCEEIQSYGMKVSTSVFETVKFTGRIQQICFDKGIKFLPLGRRDIKTFVGVTVNSGDSDIRKRMIEVYGKPGTKKRPGPTLGFSADMWAALAVAHAYAQLHRIKTK